MLTEKRQEEIIKLVDAKGSVTVQELTEYFQASESTIRSDLNVLDKKGALVIMCCATTVSFTRPHQSVSENLYPPGYSRTGCRMRAIRGSII